MADQPLAFDKDDNYDCVNYYNDTNGGDDDYGDDDYDDEDYGDDAGDYDD